MLQKCILMHIHLIVWTSLKCQLYEFYGIKKKEEKKQNVEIVDNICPKVADTY